MAAVRVLIVDDSRVVREVLRDLLDSHPRIEVVGAAEDPFEARDLIKKLNPDLITLDVEMPRMDGITFLRNLMRLRPMPVLMLSSLTQAGAEVTLDALEAGAVDFMPKPARDADDDALDDFRTLLCDKVLAAASAPIRQRQLDRSRVAPVSAPAAVLPTELVRNGLIGIGASTGGTVALLEVLRALPTQLPPIVITQHIPAAFSERLAKRIDEASRIRVSELVDGEKLLPSHAYLAPGDRHLKVEKRGGQLVGRVLDSDKVNRHRPSVEVMFDSCRAVPARNLALVMLTGMGEDGAETMAEMRRSGVFTIAQDKASSIVWGMPGAVVNRDGAEQVLPLQSIAPALVEHFKAKADRLESGA
jgi:two-component system chemotaxis response regulator CheB